MRDPSMSPNPHRPVSLRISLLDKIIFRRRSASVVCADTTTLLSSHPTTSSHFSLSHSPSLPLKDVHNLSHSSSSARSTTARRSLNASTSPVTSLRSRSPAGRPVFPSRTTAPVAVNLRSTSCRNQSSLMAPVHDSRRWSLASLPSTSGYGTPGTEHGTGSNSAFSSQCSSSEHLHEMMECMRVGGHSSSHHAGAGHRFDSNESCPSEDTQLIAFRPRSRSLTSPVMFDTEFHVDVVNRNSVYKEKFPKAKAQMEDRLNAFVNANAPLSGSTSSDVGDNTAGNRKSMIFDVDPSIDRNLLRLIADGATRFLHHQIVEIASDCLARSKDDLITCSYFCEMSQRLDETLNEAQSKTSAESFTYLSKLVQQLLMIVSRPARLLECLEFDPNEFYELLEEAEGVVREQLGSGTAKVPDLPQYIISKLGLDRDPLLDTAEDEGKEAQKQEKSEEKIKCAEKQTITLHEPVNPKAPCEDDFETIRLVSNGAYGAVYLVRHRETRQRFALKKMNKQTLVLRNQVEQVFAERDILTMTDNPFVVSFYGSFETKHHLCMLLEYVEGGDCASLLKSAGTLPLDLARLYVAETILAIDYLHSYGIVHRDIKPDNMLITSMGHIKLTDFGLSKIGLMNRTTLVAEGFDAVDTHQFKDKQLCGTPEYIAPEVILRQGYGKPVDWWALGVILYEFLIGIVPFYGDSPEDLFSKVISEEVEYPEGEEALPQEAEDLVRKLLEKNPNERLGTLNGAPQLMSHAFFDPLDFTTLLRQKAEFVPQLDNEEDTSYFDTRSDRYNHEAESCGEDEASTPMFHSFSTASPRHSIASLDPTQLPQFVQHSTSPPHAATSSAAPVTATDRPRKTSSTATQSSEDHVSVDLPESECPIPSAVLLRRRFSAQRQANLSTSSSGTTGLNTAGSSTDSSIDASNISNVAVSSSVPSANESRRSPLPRFAISSCDASNDSSDLPSSSRSLTKELSPVDETVRFRTPSPSPLQLVIPQSSGQQPMNSSSSSAFKDACYVMCSTASGQLSPGGSVSSASSLEANSPALAMEQQLSPSIAAKPPMTIRKGPFGFGFTLKSVRVYLGEHSDYYTIEHIVTSVVEGSPAYEAGLRAEDLVTEVNGQSVHNLTHPQLMHRLLSYGNELTMRVTPLSSTSIREGSARKTVGKLARKKPKRPQRRVPLEKKPRKPSALLRRLSGKRTTNDIVPGSSNQKQSFMPRSVSSQDGIVIAPGSSSTPSNSGSGTSTASPQSVSALPPIAASAAHKRLSDVGLREEHRSPLAACRPSSLRGLRPSLPSSPPVSMSSKMIVSSSSVTSPMPVSPLAREPTTSSDVPLRSRSPSPAPISSRQNPSSYHPLAPPPATKSTATPPTQSQTSSAARNLVKSLINRDKK
ncbi:hypothetical protein WR25_18484 [Diploscapter pachys]|uniref:non-specific serine/threonine protein kinase n=1 Tax=Diploscapter pachys TaxID=2018661 RepID=A0A2A2JU89_9BILA|nr:hypothetical protein WR25_18484 [Diploscapter pachys]